MLAHVDPKYVSAAKRAVRTFVVAFLAIYPLSAIMGAATGSQPVDTNLLRSAAVAGMAAVLAYLWRAFIDPIPVPTLSDTHAAQPQQGGTP